MIKAFFHLALWITSKGITRVFPDAVYIVVGFLESRAHRYICPQLSKSLIPNHLQHAIASYFTTRATPITDSQISQLIQLFIKGKNIQRANIFSSRSRSVVTFYIAPSLNLWPQQFQAHRPNLAEHIRTCSERPSVAFSEARRFQPEVRADWKKVNIEMVWFVVLYSVWTDFLKKWCIDGWGFISQIYTTFRPPSRTTWNRRRRTYWGRYQCVFFLLI